MDWPPMPVDVDAPSPNFDARTEPPHMIVLHYTGMRSGDEALRRLCDPGSKVSSHYMVEEDGLVYRLVPEERRAWHAGVSYWRGQSNLNGVSVGIEMVNPGHEWGYKPYPARQIDKVIALIDEVRSRWTIPDHHIVGHADIAPLRKNDPGELFPWRRLHEAGHGIWSPPVGAPGDPLAEGSSGVGVFALQAGLTRLGYDLPPSGEFDAATVAAVHAFQSHWRQRQVDGVADGETRATLMALLRSLAQTESGLN